MEVVDYPQYLIYPDGKVYSKYTKRYLQENDNGWGYYFVRLYKNGKGMPHTIHRLVALHYIPNPENKPFIDHKNRDRTDNRIENLRWVSHLENNQNKGNYKSNKSGHKNISYDKRGDRYRYTKTIRGKIHLKYFKTLTEALCYKYILQLKIKSGIV